MKRKSGLLDDYDDLLDTKKSRRIVRWFKRPLKRLGKLYGITFITIRPFPELKKKERGKMTKKICPKCGKPVRTSKDSYTFDTKNYWHLKCYSKRKKV